MLLALASLGGCMRIYPDPELPDVEVGWFEQDCVGGNGDVTITLNGVDDTSEHYEMAAPCSDSKATFKDVSRQRFHISGQIVDRMGAVRSMSDADVDVRNGFDERAYLSFATASNFIVQWTFDMGATCESLGAIEVGVDFSQAGQVQYEYDGYCPMAWMTGSASPGVYDVSLFAFTPSNTIVATSAPIAAVPIVNGTPRDIGTIVLTPCGASCPQP
jgi:hypothetical protein